MSQKVLKIGTLNCQSLCNKTEGIVEHFKERNLDILMLQETFMKIKDDAKVKELEDHGISFLSCPRTSGRERGGLAVIFKPTIKLKLNKKVEKYQSFEYMEMTLETEEELLRLVNVYHPPYSKGHPYTELHFVTEFEDFLETVVTKPGVPVLAGDFNMRVNNKEERYANQFKECLEGVNLTQHVPMEPTHRRGGTLDLIIAPEDISEKVKNVQIHDHGTESDHFLVECELSFTPLHEVKFRDLLYRKYKDIDVELFKKDLRETELIKATSFDSLDETCEQLQSTLFDLMDKHCPMIKKRVKLNSRRSPWFDDELDSLRKDRRRLERRWCKTRDPADKLKYKEVRDEFDKLVKLKRVVFHSESLLKSNGDCKQLWKKINDLLGKPNTTLPDHTNAEALAEDFKTMFSDKPTKIRKNIEQESAELKEDAELLLPTTKHVPCNSPEVEVEEMSGAKEEIGQFNNFCPVGEDELLKTIKSMSNKFCSLDPVPTWLFVSCFEELKTVLLYIANESFSTGVFPSSYKKAIVKPTIKNHSANKDLLNVYRPVSNLSFTSKLLEKLSMNQTNLHLEGNNLHCSSQSGYRPKHSCETLMVRMFDDILTSMEEKNVISLLLLDLSAAFDTVDHTILLERLNTDYKIGGVVLEWFKSYLSGRSFTVSVGDKYSSPCFLWFGVPQGSILGPILFILYTKALSAIAKKHGLIIQLYADDSQLYIGFKPANNEVLTSVASRLEACLKEIMVWMTTNFMKLNMEKTQIINLGTNNVLKKSDPMCINVGGTQVLSSDFDEVISLGVKIDPNLNMRKHIAKVRQSCFYTISNLGRIKNLLTRDLKIMLVKQLILSKVDYHNALYINLPDSDVKKLQAIVNAAVRYIYGAGKRIPARPLLIQAHILPVRYRIKFKICLLAFKALNAMAPEYLEELVDYSTPRIDDVEASSVLETPRRSNDRFLLKTTTFNYTKTALTKRTFTYAAPQLWNELPYNIRTCTGVDLFKKKLKTHYFKLFLDDPAEIV